MEMPTICRLCDTEVSLNDMVQNPLDLKELICKECEEEITVIREMGYEIIKKKEK